MSSEIFKLEITVTAQHIDVRNHVNNLVYLQWCLDAASGHWEEKTTKNFRSNYTWYVLNHSINYKASAYLGDTLEVHSWVSSSKGVKSERNYKIVRPSDCSTIVEASTLWCLLDAKTLRPMVIPEEIRILFE